MREASQASHVPSTGAHSLTTVSSAPRLRGLFHPRAASRALFPFRGFSLRAAHPPRQRALPPCRWLDRCSKDLSAQRPHLGRASTPRLQSTRRRVLIPPVISRRDGRSPPRVPCSSRLTIPRHRRWLTQSRPLMTFTRTGLRLRDRRSQRASSVLEPRDRTALSPEQSARTSFVACRAISEKTSHPPGKNF